MAARPRHGQWRGQHHGTSSGPGRMADRPGRGIGTARRGSGTTQVAVKADPHSTQPREATAVSLAHEEDRGMRMIALEEHLLPADVAAAISLDPATLQGKAAALDDLGEGRLQAMDAAGIDVQVLSALAYAVQELDPGQALDVSRDLNDRMAGAVAAHPGRFRAFATLPMCDPKASAAELTRAVEELGFIGTMIHGQTHGVFLDDRSADPVLATAERLGISVYLHPAPPPTAVRTAYFSGLEPAVAATLATAGWGWHAE